MKDKIFFWLDANFMMYILSYHLQKKIDADFYAIYDLPNKTRTFFQSVLNNIPALDPNFHKSN